MPSNDKVSRLISESYDRELSDSEKRLLENELKTNTEVQGFDSFLKRLRESTLQASADGIDSTLSNQAQLAATKRAELKEAIEAELSKAIPVADSLHLANPNQNENLALATVLIDRGAMTSEQLGEAVENWSAFGSVSLHDHLVHEQVLDPDELKQFQQIAADTIRNLDGNDTVRESTDEFKQSMEGIASLLGIKQDDSLGHAHFRIGGEYSVIRKIGGGMGSVWLARDNALERTVAIKTIAKSTSDANESILARFAREAKVTGRLEHPNIVSVYQFGEDEATGNLYYSMRYVGKRTLQDAIFEYHHRKADNTAGQSEFQNLLAAFLTVCQAIGYAHSKGVIHRDLKPQNVALDDFGQITVIDWGLAKFIDDKEIAIQIDDLANQFATEKTINGQVLGTPLYMSPEQAAGRIDLVDERTDVYGLGAILFEIITGHAPHIGRCDDSTSSRMINELLTQIVSVDSPVIDPEHDVDPVLARICERAISKRKYSRFGSATELYDAVQEWQGNIANRLKRKEECKARVRDAESKLNGLCEDVNRNLRFLSILPPVQGIMDAIQESPKAESLDVWRQRLEIIIEGLLRTNADIASISFYRIVDDKPGMGQEICGVQRHPDDSTFVSVVPKSRLLSLELDRKFPEIIDAEPGDSIFTIVDQYRSRKSGSEKFLQAVLPIFDNGELFGFFEITCKIRAAFNAPSFLTAPLTVVDQNGHSIFASAPRKQIAETTEELIAESAAATEPIREANLAVFETDCTFSIRFDRANVGNKKMTLFLVSRVNE